MYLRYDVNIPDGYTVRHSEEKLEMEEAVNILHSRRQRKYGSIQRNKDEAILKKELIVCPFCGRCGNPYIAEPHISISELSNWRNMQLSLFPDTVCDSLQLHRINLPEIYSCSFCGRNSERAFSINHYMVELIGKKILLSLCGSYEGMFGIEEQLEFNLNNGHAVSRRFSDTGSVTCIKDVSTPALLCRCRLYKEIEQSAVLRRKLKKCWEACTGSIFPFSISEFSPTLLLNLIRFTGGYGREFYLSIPATYEGDLPRSMAKSAKTMRKAGNLPALYHSSSLPDMKSIKKLFFNNPVFFFFLKESESLWALCGRKPDYFRELLQMSDALRLLSLMHVFPATSVFIRDLINLKGIRVFIQLFQGFPEAAKSAALEYAALSDIYRKEALNDWHRRSINSGVIPNFVISPCPDAGIDEIINGYTFHLIHSPQEYDRAGKGLSNCLNAGYRERKTAVVIVRKGHAYAAAIEYDSSNVLIQAKARFNAPLESSPELNTAVRTWVKNHRLVIQEKDEWDGFNRL